MSDKIASILWNSRSPVRESADSLKAGPNNFSFEETYELIFGRRPPTIDLDFTV